MDAGGDAPGSPTGVGTQRIAAFSCDAMLGGLARWLRVAGHDATWHPGIADAALVRLAREQRRILLSCDGGIFTRADVAAGDPPSLRVRQDIGPVAQLLEVVAALDLRLGDPRCMTCGGELSAVAKEAVRDRVPPTTFAVTDRFWECTGCSRLLWRGAHWRRIEQALSAIPSARTSRS
ncbi:MAG TPA: Mut7-C RNAse domain-containing protein [Planctomycetota bacterium]|nr:Mut7-C RNAse domain-containing protein [Planctomycetota bacterium]